MAKILRFLVPLALIACEQPSSSTTVDVVLDAPVVLTVTTSDDDEPSWNVRLAVPSAPAGDYLVFEQSTQPTSADGVKGFDATPCDTIRKCAVPGLGNLFARGTLAEPGALTLSAIGALDVLGGSTHFFTVVRRVATGPAPEPTPLKATVLLGANGGTCLGADPDPPGVTVSSLPAPQP